MQFVTFDVEIVEWLESYLGLMGEMELRFN